MTDRQKANLLFALQIIGGVSVILTIIVSAWNLTERFRGPKLRAAMLQGEAIMSPLDIPSLHIGAAAKRFVEQYGTNDSQLATSLRLTVSETNFPGRTAHIEIGRRWVQIDIFNFGSQTAAGVRVLMAGEGKAEIFEHHEQFSKSAIDWKNSVAIGDIRPGAHVVCRLWNTNISSIFGANSPAVQYDKGTVTIRETRMFFGWDSDLVAFFLELPSWLRWALGLGFVVVVFGLFVVAVRRGYIVLSPMKKTQPSQSGQTIYP
jgi:hypothetical protein